MNDVAAGHAARAGDGALAAWLAPILAARGTTLDAAQAVACDRLQELAVALRAFRARVNPTRTIARCTARSASAMRCSCADAARSTSG